MIRSDVCQSAGIAHFEGDNMYRLFETHKVRTVTELSGCLWDFAAENGYACKAAVPGCWEMMPGLGNYRGKAVYTRRFNAGGTIRLEFKGVSHTAEIRVDGIQVGEHYGAFTPFSVVIENLKDGEHTLEVAVSNEFSEASALHIPNDYMTYGGINRPVVLEQLGKAWIRWAHYTTEKVDDEWQLRAELCIQGVDDCKDLKAQIVVNGQTLVMGQCAAVQGEEIIVTETFSMGTVQEWNMENPALYTVEAQLCSGEEVVDDLIERVGFREITIRGRHILLNGRAVRIKGVCRHEDYAGFGCAIPWTALQRDVQLIRDLGCNSVRTSHYPNDEIFLDLCDEQGILVWEENHARGINEEGMRNPNFRWQCELCIHEMIENHYNHPSIYIWGILNECETATEYGRSCYQEQLEQIRSLDASRPRTFATCRYEREPLRVTDICLDLPDVVSYNIYPLWYYDVEVPQFLEELHACIEGTDGAGKPLLISEIGAGAEYGFHSAEHLKWSEEYHADALEKQIRGVLTAPVYSGLYVWQFCDVRVSNEWFANRPKTHNNKGLVDEYRRPKMGYQVVKRIYGEYSNYMDE